MKKTINNVERIADEIIAEMRRDGLSYGQMLAVIRIAKQRFEELRKIKKQTDATQKNI